MPPFSTPLAGSKYNLNSAGVAGFFGGEEAIPAMAAVCLFRGGRWLGWYNSPGSYTIAKRFGRMANSRFWAGLFPGPRVSPAVTFGFDGTQGPMYIAALSGTTMKTGHLGYLTMEWCKQRRSVAIPGRITSPNYVAYLDMAGADFAAPVECLPFKDAVFALIPITTSVIACIMCVLVYDWFSFSMIFLGIISSGSASYVIGGGKLTIKWPYPAAEGAPPGHGILIGENNVVVIKGSERDVKTITRGHFELEMNLRFQANEEDDADEVGRIAGDNHAVGFCSLLLLFQFLFQLLLVPQGSLFGQIMFLISLVMSWAFNSYLASLEKEKIQARILFQTLGNPNILRFRVGTRTQMAVFVCLLLSHRVELSPDEQRRCLQKILHSSIPNDTVVWRRWKEKVINQFLHLDESESFPFLEEDEGDQELSNSDRLLLTALVRDAASAIRGYFSVRGELPHN